MSRSLNSKGSMILTYSHTTDRFHCYEGSRQSGSRRVKLYIANTARYPYSVVGPIEQLEVIVSIDANDLPNWPREKRAAVVTPLRPVESNRLHNHEARMKMIEQDRQEFKRHRVLQLELLQQIVSNTTPIISPLPKPLKPKRKYVRRINRKAK